MDRPQRIIAALATLAALGAVLAQPAKAGPSNDPLTFVLDNRVIKQPIDYLTWCGDCVLTDYTTQEPWVTNPTTCMWDTDDEFRYVSSGNVLAAGTTATFVECSYRGLPANGVVEHRASTDLASPSPNLIVTYAFTWDGGSQSFVVPAVFNPTSHRWDYDMCIDNVPHPIGGTEVEVAGSHGGRAVPVTITVSVQNPTSQKVNKTGGAVSYGWIGTLPVCS